MLHYNITVSAGKAGEGKFAQGTKLEIWPGDDAQTYIAKGFTVTYSGVGLPSYANEIFEVAPPCKSASAGQDGGSMGTVPDLSGSKMDLRKRYPYEANAHRAMLGRQKQGRVVHPDFKEFRSFMRHVGPMPGVGCTLDRIDNTDPEYAPGKVRWADRYIQNNNKSDTLTFHYSRTNDVYTASRLAALQNVSPAAIRKRRADGWTDDEICEGRRSHSPGKRCAPDRLPPELQRVVERPLTGKEILFARTASAIAHERQENGRVMLPANPYEFMVISNTNEKTFLHESQLPRAWDNFLDRILPEWWAEHKPHGVFDELCPDEQALIEFIDPDFVKMRSAKNKQVSRLLDAL